MGTSPVKRTGRPSLYETRIEPRLGEIRRAYNDGATIQQIATDLLKISFNTLNAARKKHPELDRIFIAPDFTKIITDLRGALYKRAVGFKETETKTVFICSPNDQKKITAKQIEKSEHYYPPDVAAINLALKNYDKANWSNDPAELELRQKALDLQLRKYQGEITEEREAKDVNDEILKQLYELRRKERL